MTDRRPLIDLAGTMPKSAVDTLKVEQPDPSFHVNQLAPAGYVWPDIQLDNESPSASVLLIRAPGAMGKSSAARALASYLNAPLVDVSELPVGSDSLTGLFVRVLGWSQTPTFLSRLQSGTASLIIDGLDEAQLRAGRDHYLAFLDNIFEILGGASRSLQLIMLGRRDAMEWAQLQLEERGLVTATATIPPLTYEQSSQLILSWLDTFTVDGQPFTAHRTHPVPFKQLCDATFVDIASALGLEAKLDSQSWSEVEDFLGYPPVLTVIARRLAVQNPVSPERLTGAGQRRRRGELLRQIVESILLRERQKVQTLLAPALGLNLGDPKVRVLYEIEEQMLRLVQHLATSDLQIKAPAHLSATEKATYDEQISFFVPDHPFLRERALANVVFSDYLRAYISSSELGNLQGASHSVISDACLHVGPFYASFVEAFSKPDGSMIGQIREELVDDIIKSHLLGPGDNEFYYELNAGVARLALRTDRRPGTPGEHTYFAVVDPSGVLELTSPIEGGLLLSDQGVVFKPGESGEVRLGPGLFAVIREVELMGTSLSVVAGLDRDGDQDVVFLLTESLAHDPSLRVSVFPADCFAVNAETISYQMRPHHFPVQQVGGRPDPHLNAQVVLGVRRILFAFHRSVDDSPPSCYSERIAQQIVGPSPVFKAVLNGLVELGLIRDGGRNYYLVPARLAEAGLNYASLRQPDLEKAFQSLLPSLWATESMRALSEAS